MASVQRIHTIHGSFMPQSPPGCSSRIQSHTPFVIVNIPKMPTKATRAAPPRPPPCRSTEALSCTPGSRKRSARPLPHVNTSPRRPPPPPPSRCVPVRDTQSYLDAASDPDTSSASMIALPTSPIEIVPYAPASVTDTEPDCVKRERAERDRAMRWRIVAGMLLNRASVRPMTRKFPAVPRTYVRSGLSRVVEVDI